MQLELLRPVLTFLALGVILLWNVNVMDIRYDVSYQVNERSSKNQTTQIYPKIDLGTVERRLEKAKSFSSEVCEMYKSSADVKHFKRFTNEGSLSISYNDWMALKTVNKRFLFYAKKENFMYCKILKNGSTNWAYYLLKLAGLPDSLIDTDIGIHKYVREYYPDLPRSGLKKAMERSFKFMITRHPFERILSAYRDKLEDYLRDIRFRKGYYYKNYGKNIVKKFRKRIDNEISSSEANRTEPTWSEFVEYIINSPFTELDYHWKPMYTMCSPCAIDFDAIADMETFSEDTHYIIKKLGLEDKLKVKWIHKSGDKSTKDVARQYFNQLTQEQVDKLYGKFKIDFDLFGYSHQSYKKMAWDFNSFDENGPE